MPEARVARQVLSYEQATQARQVLLWGQEESASYGQEESAPTWCSSFGQFLAGKGLLQEVQRQRIERLRGFIIGNGAAFEHIQWYFL
jgi:hypothetical protein